MKNNLYDSVQAIYEDNLVPLLKCIHKNGLSFYTKGKLEAYIELFKQVTGENVEYYQEDFSCGLRLTNTKRKIIEVPIDIISE